MLLLSMNSKYLLELDPSPTNINRDDETHQKEAASLGLKEMSSGEEMELPKCLEELAGNEFVFHLLDSLQFHSKSPYVHCISNQ
ncbi:unnamed protein product [Brassica napus]|uniref:(rape) hypothetical protein n=1 Tax=Brassica napus TaxID=3708 RepID=A0A816UXT9_BRANA|nr:unnamed protein product [Brassica napus]